MSTTTLSDGRIAQIRAPKGRDSVKAARVLSETDLKNPMAVSMALLAQVTTIDGIGLTYEDMMELSLADIGKLQVAMGQQDVNFTPLASPT